MIWPGGFVGTPVPPPLPWNGASEGRGVRSWTYLPCPPTITHCDPSKVTVHVPAQGGAPPTPPQWLRPSEVGWEADWPLRICLSAWGVTLNNLIQECQSAVFVWKCSWQIFSEALKKPCAHAFHPIKRRNKCGSVLRQPRAAGVGAHTHLALWELRTRSCGFLLCWGTGGLPVAGDPPGAGSGGRGGMAEAPWGCCKAGDHPSPDCTHTEFQRCLPARPRPLLQRTHHGPSSNNLWTPTLPFLLASFLLKQDQNLGPFDCLFLLLCTPPADLIFGLVSSILSSPNPAPSVTHPRTSPEPHSPLPQIPWASLVAQSVKNLPEMQETGVSSLGPIPGSGKSPGEGNGNPLHYSCLKNPMDRGAWWGCKRQTRPSV